MKKSNKNCFEIPSLIFSPFRIEEGKFEANN